VVGRHASLTPCAIEQPSFHSLNALSRAAARGCSGWREGEPLAMR